MMSHDFRSDNSAPPSPEIVQAVLAASTVGFSPYANDTITGRVRERLGELFEREVDIFPVISGTAGNALVLSMVARAFGKIFCHADSHIMIDECGAVEFFSHGSRLVPLPGEVGKITAGEIAALDEPEDVHRLRPAAISVSQATERGTVYSVDELKALGASAGQRGLPLHMDGTRFPNAMASLKASAAALTWQSGVDVLCLGATKGGAIGAEAVVFFDRTLARDFGRQVKRGGHMVSKAWFLSAQLEAYLQNDLWLRNAVHGNLMARNLADGLASAVGLAPEFPVEANMVFVRMSESQVQRLEAAGFVFYRWDNQERPLVRLVTSHATSRGAVEALVDTLRAAH